MVGLAVEVEAPSSVCPARRCDRRRRRRGGPGHDPARRAARRRPPPGPAIAERPSSGSSPASLIASSSGTPSRSRSSPACSGVIRPVASREPRQATPNREPSSSTNIATPTGRVGATPAVTQPVDRGERGDHPEGPVERAALVDRVEMRADQDALARADAVGSPPRHRVALTVVLEVEAASRALLGVPRGTLTLGRRERRADDSRRYGRRARPVRARATSARRTSHRAVCQPGPCPSPPRMAALSGISDTVTPCRRHFRLHRVTSHSDSRYLPGVSVSAGRRSPLETEISADAGQTVAALSDPTWGDLQMRTFSVRKAHGAQRVCRAGSVAGGGDQAQGSTYPQDNGPVLTNPVELHAEPRPVPGEPEAGRLLGRPRPGPRWWSAAASPRSRTARRTTQYNRSNVFAFETAAPNQGVVNPDFDPDVQGGDVWSVLVRRRLGVHRRRLQERQRVSRARPSPSSACRPVSSTRTSSPTFKGGRITDMAMYHGQLIVVRAPSQQRLMSLNPNTGKPTPTCRTSSRAGCPTATRPRCSSSTSARTGSTWWRSATSCRSTARTGRGCSCSTSATPSATLSSWNYPPNGVNCSSGRVNAQAYIQDVDFAPDSCWFAVAAFGFQFQTRPLRAVSSATRSAGSRPTT